MFSWTICARWAVLRRQWLHVHGVLAVRFVRGSISWGLSYTLWLLLGSRVASV